MSCTNSPILGVVLKGYPRVSETFISNEIELLESQGYKIRIISMRKPREDFTHNSVKRIRAKADYLPSRMLGNLSKLLFHAARAAFRHPRGFSNAFGLMLRRLGSSRKTATIKHFLQACHIVSRIIPESGITHLHAHFAHSPTSVTLFASRISGIPFSFTGHAKDIWTQKPEQLQDKIAEARFVVTCTRHNAEYLQRLNRTSTPIHCVYHGIDLRLFSSNGNPPAAKPPFKIFTIARFTAKKGLPTVLKALKILKDRGVPFEYRLVGDGDDREDILKLLRELKIKNQTQWLGTQPHENILRYFHESDVFVLGCEIAPNGDRDGIPNVLVESMAMKVPVVATQVSGIPELVVNGETGLLVEPGNPEAMAEAIIEALSDANFRLKAAESGFAKVHKEFDNQALIRELAEVYRQHGIRPACS